MAPQFQDAPDLLQAQANPFGLQHEAQPPFVRLRVEPVASLGALRSRQEPERLVVTQRTHVDVDAPGQLTDLEFGLALVLCHRSHSGSRLHLPVRWRVKWFFQFGAGSFRIGIITIQPRGPRVPSPAHGTHLARTELAAAPRRDARRAWATRWVPGRDAGRPSCFCSALSFSQALPYRWRRPVWPARGRTRPVRAATTGCACPGCRRPRCSRSPTEETRRWSFGPSPAAV